MDISILGCGWLGLPAGRHWVNEGHRVCGSTTQKEKVGAISKEGIQPALLLLETSGIRGEIPASYWQSEVLFVNIPPGRAKGDVRTRHPNEIRTLIDQLNKSSVKWVIFASSTSVYGPTGGWKKEADAGTEPASSDSGEALLECESMLRSNTRFDTTIIRFGGLYGYDRHPAKNLSGRSGLRGGDKPVNLIHQDDAVTVLSSVVSKNLRNETLNAVSDKHPTRKEFYQKMADRMNLPRPDFLPDQPPEDGYKIINNSRMKSLLDIELAYPDPSAPSP